MKSVRSMLLVVLLSAGAVAFAQSDAHQMTAPKTAAPKSEAQISFDTIKTLAGEWEGPVGTDMPEPMRKAMKAQGADPDIQPLHVTIRVTSRGNVLVHEFQVAGTPLDATKYDHPVTMVYVDGDKLNLVHYCDAGNRPRMLAKASSDAKTMAFDFAELSGSDKHGHMNNAVFTIIDANHHSEEWTYVLPNGTPIHAKFTLTRVN